MKSLVLKRAKSSLKQCIRREELCQGRKLQHGVVFEKMIRDDRAEDGSFEVIQGFDCQVKGYFRLITCIGQLQPSMS